MTHTRHLVMVGLSHHTSPIELRERLALDGKQREALLARLTGEDIFEEAVVISTCNRVEYYATTNDPRTGLSNLRQHFLTRAQDCDDRLYARSDGDAVLHAFRVASSLDSMVVGEPQILGQLKEAFGCAQEQGHVGSVLGRCFHRAFAVAKRVRNETGIAEGSVSVGSIACDLASGIFGDLAGRRALLIGAGEMGEAAARTVSQRGGQLHVINRSRERAQQVADACGGTARDQSDLIQELTDADVVISSTSSERYVITKEQIRGVVKARRHRPIFLIDIAVPRDIDPRVESVDNVFLYDVDDLQRVADENLSTRKHEAEQAMDIVQHEVGQFESWLRSLSLTPTLVELREKVNSLLHQELERTVPRLKSLNNDEREMLRTMCNAMSSKLLHRPTVELKRSHEQPEGAELLEAIHVLFGLDGTPPPKTRSGNPYTASVPARTDPSDASEGSMNSPAPAHTVARRKQS